jgi:hypothetical protein
MLNITEELAADLSVVTVGGDIEVGKRARNRQMVATGGCTRERWKDLSEKIREGKAKARIVDIEEAEDGG